MPIVKATLTVPANTPQNAPVIADMAPPERWSTRWGILFPRNAAGLVGVQIRNVETLIVPTTGGIDEWIHDDGHLVEWDDEIDLGMSPRKLRVKAFNLDTKFPRTIEVRVVVQAVTLRQILGALAQGH